MDIADYLWREGGGHAKMPDAVKAASGDATEFAYVEVLAETLMEQSWQEITKEIDEVVPNRVVAAAVKKRMADHVWCSLLVTLIHVIETIEEALQFLTDKTKELLKQTVGKHFESGFTKVVADAVVNIVVDKVWHGLTVLVTGHFPLTGKKVLRALRVLAVFACPSVEQHQQLYKHAMQPLMEEGRGLVTEKVKIWITALFTAWWQRKAPDPEELAA